MLDICTSSSGNREAQPLRVLLVDNHPIVRRGLRQLISEEFPSTVFGEARNLAEARQELGNADWSLVILEISLPDGNGLDLLKEARYSHPNARVLILSMYAERQYALPALRAGAAGYVTKDCAFDELIKAVRKILAGGRYVSPALAEQLAGEIGDGTNRPPHELLSARELTVACSVAAGKRPSDIAAAMGLSAKTVSTYKHRAMAKMQVATDADLVRYAIEHTLI